VKFTLTNRLGTTLYAVMAETHAREDSEKVVVGYARHEGVANAVVEQLLAEYDAFCVRMTVWHNANPNHVPSNRISKYGSNQEIAEREWYTARLAAAADAREGMMCTLGADERWHPSDGVYSYYPVPEFYVLPLQEIS
jgi:hypothetical protein